MAMKPKINAVCHPDRNAWAHHLCRSCFDTVRKTGKLLTSLRGPERIAAEEYVPLVGNSRKKLHPSGIEPVAVKSAQTEEPAFNTADPLVASHISGAIVKALLDFRSAVRVLRPDLTPFQQATLAYALERDPNIQAAVQTELAKRGLGDEDKRQYIAMLWQMAGDIRPESEKLRLQSLRLLARVFLPEGTQAGAVKPESLPLQGLDAGLEKMGLSDSVVAAIPPTQLSNVEEEIENQEEE